MKNLVFVYGSLKKSFHNHHYLENSKFICETSTLDEFSMLDLKYYPAITYPVGNKSYRVLGELYEVDNNTLKSLDQLEGYPNYYDRTVVGLGNNKQAYIYLMKNKVLEYFNINIDRALLTSNNKYISWEKK